MRLKIVLPLISLSYLIYGCGGETEKANIPQEVVKSEQIKQSDETHSAGEVIEEEFKPVKQLDFVINIGESDFETYITPALVRIERGSFTMGDTLVEGESDEQPTHKVDIRYDFYIGKYEVTFREFDKFCEETGCVKPSKDEFERGNRPVNNVTWFEAKAYTDWLSKKTGEKYRLPTEAEWEFVARGGANSKYFFGDSKNDLKHYSWFWDNSKSQSHVVGEKEPNQYGVHDMLGNVWEWCEDWYQNSYDNAPITGSAFSINTNEKVLRGGSWNDFSEHLRVTNRYGFDPTIKMNDTGFRVVKEVSELERSEGL